MKEMNISLVQTIAQNNINIGVLGGKFSKFDSYTPSSVHNFVL